MIENEGPRGPFREKLGEKLLDWRGPKFRERVFVLADPWAGFSFADLHCTDPVLGGCRERVGRSRPRRDHGASGRGCRTRVPAGAPGEQTTPPLSDGHRAAVFRSP